MGRVRGAGRRASVGKKFDRYMGMEDERRRLTADERARAYADLEDDEERQLAEAFDRYVGVEHEPRRPLVRGDSAETTVWPKTSVVRRRVLRQLGISARDLSPVGRQRLDAFDQHLAAYEMRLPPSEAPSPLVEQYAQLAEAARRALDDLAPHLAEEERPAAG